MAELFLEIGCEEIPAGFLPPAMKDLERLLTMELQNARVPFGAVTTLATPRRIAIVISDVTEQQPDAETTVMGPSRSVAFAADGTPTKAGEGFARGQGIAAAELQIVTTEKGEYVAAVKKETGRPTAQLLAEVLPRVIGNIPFRKSMRWGNFDTRFARPIHWIVALFGGSVIPFSFGNIESGNTSRGHRFMANTTFTASDFASYLQECERHFVIPDPERRKEIIRTEVAKLAEKSGGAVLQDEELVEQVAYLVEYPSAVLGTFSADFLAVPKEVLITSMKSHQRYFSLVDAAGKLLPAFITINNTVAEDPAVVVKGNERVLRARLSDARFFYDEDRKVSLEKRVESLKSVVYQAKLGTSYEKMERFRTLAEELATRLNPAVKEKASHAAYLCKADLVTGMVGEFPEVQGIMGREYALLEGVDPEVAAAIHEHYLPTQAGGELPASDIGAFVSIADKLDTICGCFGVGLIPTGTADPYALRRSALGIINIILDRGYDLPLDELVDRSLELLAAKLTRPAEEVRRDVLSFFEGRFTNLMAGRYPTDAVDAVTSVCFGNLVDSAARIAALAEFKNRPDFQPLAVAVKRVGNIVKEGVAAKVDPSLLAEDAEKALAAAVAGVAETAAALVAKREYLPALTELAGLKPQIDSFFDQVMVMAEDERIRENRLALLQEIRALFRQIADFAKIAA